MSGKQEEECCPGKSDAGTLENTHWRKIKPKCDNVSEKKQEEKLGKSDAGRGADGHRPYQLHIYLSTFSFETFNFLTSILSTTYLSIFVSGLIQVVDRDTIEMLDNVIDSPVFIDALEKVPPVSLLVLGALSPSSTSLSSATGRLS